MDHGCICNGNDDVFSPFFYFARTLSIAIFLRSNSIHRRHSHSTPPIRMRYLFININIPFRCGSCCCCCIPNVWHFDLIRRWNSIILVKRAIWCVTLTHTHTHTLTTVYRILAMWVPKKYRTSANVEQGSCLRFFWIVPHFYLAIYYLICIRFSR